MRRKYRVVRHEVAQPPDPSYRLIPLTQGQNAKIDADMYESIATYNWFASWNPHTRSFYAIRNNGAGKIRMHHVVLGLQASDEVDHKNHDTLDNRRLNLRRASRTRNQCNRRKQSNNTSGYIGVTWLMHRKKWDARVKFKGKYYFVGYFSSAEDAGRARDVLARRLHGEFAHLNF